jgi:biopolymer transport protein ExbB
VWGELAFGLRSANVYILAILGLGFLGLVVIFERFIMLQWVYNIDFQKFLVNLRKMIASKDTDRAINLCKSVSKTSLPKIGLHALEASETDPTTIRGTIEEETIGFLPQLEARLMLLPALATLVLLIGILGTIDSLWESFHSVNVLDTAKKQASLAQGVASSLNGTALGLIACMTLLTFHQLLKGLATKISERIHHGVTVLHNLLVPPDVAYVAHAGSMSAPADVTSNSHSDDKKTGEGNSEDDGFDDSSIGDIKDEEEII